MHYGITKICLLTVLVVFVNIAGCTLKYIDTVTIFEIKGEVYDQETNLPIENTAVLFKDKSDADGKFTARLNYLWRSRDTTLQNPPRKTFDVVLFHKAYEPRRFHFDESDLQQGGMRFEINLDKIYLQPKEEEEK
jgi:hypothetical protein